LDFNDDFKDPFYDPSDPSLIGLAYLNVLPLLYNMGNPSELWIHEEGNNKKIRGLLKVNIVPLIVG
jgi:hypothetical protein